MNGDLSTRITVVNDSIVLPNGLCVDYEAEKVYWTDAHYLHIDVMDYDGSNRQTIIQTGLKYPFAITHFKHRLYWTDWKTQLIYSFDKNTDRGPKDFFTSTSELWDVHIWDSQRQPYKTHPCENNGGCSHLCLLAPYPPGYSCACPVGIKLINNLTCADGPQELLIVVRRTDINVIYLDSPDYSYKAINLTNVKYAIAVDYDPINEFIYWTDDEEAKIQRAKLNGSQQTDVISWEVHHPDGIAIDWVARNLYWTDSGTDRIEVATLEGTFRKAIIFEDLYEPRAIVVAPDLGWMFWSDWNKKTPRIERSNLDGTERTSIIEKDIQWPNGVALDVVNKKIYWCDAKMDKIEYSNMDGTDRRMLINNELPHVFGFSLMGDYIYWTDWQRRAVDRVNKETGKK